MVSNRVLKRTRGGGVHRHLRTRCVSLLGTPYVYLSLAASCLRCDNSAPEDGGTRRESMTPSPLPRLRESFPPLIYYSPFVQSLANGGTSKIEPMTRPLARNGFGPLTPPSRRSHNISGTKPNWRCNITATACHLFRYSRGSVLVVKRSGLDSNSTIRLQRSLDKRVVVRDLIANGSVSPWLYRTLCQPPT